MPTSYINFTGQIKEDIANKFMAACAAVVATDHPDCLYFLFSSPGGDVNAGVAIYNYLRALPVARLVMHNIGSIDSVANVIFHAADERYAAPHSTFHFHGVAMNLAANAHSLNHSQIRELQSQIGALETKIAIDSCRAARLLSSRGIRRYHFCIAKGCYSICQPADHPPQYEVLQPELFLKSLGCHQRM